MNMIYFKQTHKISQLIVEVELFKFPENILPLDDCRPISH